MLDSIVALLSGGATGLLGTGLGFVMRYFGDKQKHANEIELRRLEMDMIAAEAAAAASIEARRAESEESRASWEALSNSYQAVQRWSAGDSRWLVMVDVVRGLVRPSLTVWLCLLVAAIYFTADDPDIRARIVITVLYLATVAVTWWFGERAGKKPKGAV